MTFPLGAAEPLPSRRATASRARGVVFVAIPLLFLSIWELYKYIAHVSDYKLPHVWRIFTYFTTRLSNGELTAVFLARSVWTTAGEALLGLAVAIALGVSLALLIAYVPKIGRGVLPLVVGSQAVPILALAPPLLVWLGTGWKSKAIISGYVAFFPVVIFAVRGFTSTKPELVSLMRSYAAGPWSSFWKIRLPAAVPHLFTGLRAAASLSVVGAIVAELPVGAGSGIGVVIHDAAQFYIFNPPALWAATIAAFALGATFFGAVVLCERLALARLGGKH